MALAVLAGFGCATDKTFQEGERLIQEGKTEAGLWQLEQAVKEQPKNLEYRAALLRSRESHVARLLAQGQGALQAGNLDEAEGFFREVLRVHTENQRAPAGLAAVGAARRSKGLLAEAGAALKNGDFETARHLTRGVLAQAPDHEEAKTLLKEVEERAGKTGGVVMPQLSTALRRPVSLEFREATLKGVFEALSRQSGLNFVFDKDVRLDQRTTVFARDTAIVDALDMILATSQLARKVLNANTLIIYPNIPAKQKEYQDLVVKSFFLSNADAKQALVMIKTIARVRDVFVDERLNMIMVRDTPESVRLVEKLVHLADRPEAEVMLEVEVMEVKRSKLLELGVQWPTQLSLLGKEKVVDRVTDAQGNTISQTTKYLDVPLTLDLLRNIDKTNTGISPTPGVVARGEDGDVNLLANPRIRVKNKEKAKIHIGDKVPVITSNVTSTGVTSESVSYLDVGLKLDVEPQVQLQGDVSIKVGMEVSNIVREVKSGTGTLTYQLGSRNANTVLRLRDGETQVLAGLISDEDRAGVSKLPGLGDLPLLGRLFSSHRDEKNKTEIVLLITPRIIRNVERPSLQDTEFFAGTDGNTSDQPLRLRPAARAGGLPARLPVASPPGQATEAAEPEPQGSTTE
jgi:general secretion pathway protein D